MKCLNCDAEATLKVKNDSSEDQFYCDADLPVFLTEKGFESRVEPLLEEPAPKPKKKKEEPTPVAEPTPEPVVEEKVEEAPAVE